MSEQRRSMIAGMLRGKRGAELALAYCLGRACEAGETVRRRGLVVPPGATTSARWGPT